MDSFGASHMTNARQVVSNLFADYRAEWLQPEFASLFIPPPYLPKLENHRPCFLVGGRGTGKTTSLRSLRFDAAHARATSDNSFRENLNYFGIYIRINKNRVRAFDMHELDTGLRRRAFSHYFNVLVGMELCQLTLWLESERKSLARLDLRSVSQAYGLDNVSSIRDLLSNFKRGLTDLELFVNNGGRTQQPILSVADAPIRAFANALIDADLLEDRLLFCCIDEYENLSVEQQSVLNAYIKHSEPPISYKIGMRRGGLYTRKTISEGDQIATPDDFSEIDIAQEGFDLFAEEVADHRLARAREQGVNVPEKSIYFLPEMSFEEEAKLLGCERIAEKVRDQLEIEKSSLIEWFDMLAPSKSYFLQYWHESSGESISSLVNSWHKDSSMWDSRLGNYGYASLFWLSNGRKGARIRKYYSGMSTILAMASGNIRFFLELIDEAIQIQLATGWDPNKPLIVLPKAQTEAAKLVGKRRLGQLEGLSERGVEIKRLVLAIGKVFFEFARDPIGRAPEKNSFILTGSPASINKISNILIEGVAHLAFEVTAKTKATSAAEMRDDEYRIHPIYCAFFEYSHRKKRRVTFQAESLLKLSSQPAAAILEMMSDTKQVSKSELPEQLAMFTDFYEGGA
jgi:hypothetical protein